MDNYAGMSDKDKEIADRKIVEEAGT